MGKLLLLLSMISLIVLCAYTIVSPNSPIMWLASGSMAYQYMRVTLALVLVAQFMSDPPRRRWFRALTGALALAVGYWTLSSTYSYHMQFADTLVFLGASFAIGITALEYQASNVRTKLTNLKAGT